MASEMVSGMLSPETAMRAAIDHIRPYRKKRLVFWIGFLIVGIAINIQHDFPSNKFVPFLALMAIGGIEGYRLSSRAIRRRFAALYRSVQDDFSQPVTFAWDGDGLTITYSAGHARTPWNRYTKFRESSEFFFVYSSDDEYFVIPKEWFTTTTQLDDLRGALRRIPKAPGWIRRIFR